MSYARKALRTVGLKYTRRETGADISRDVTLKSYFVLLFL